VPGKDLLRFAGVIEAEDLIGEKLAGELIIGTIENT